MLAGAFAVLGLVFTGLANCWSIFAFLTPYESLGVWKTSDLDGQECVVEVLEKPLSCTVPPGELPRIKVVAVSRGSTSTLVHDTEWRFAAGLVLPVRGGIEVYASPILDRGLRFHIRKGGLFLAREGMRASVSKWEVRLDGLIVPGMIRSDVERVLQPRVKAPIREEDLTVDGITFTQYFLDQEAALIVEYSEDRMLIRSRVEYLEGGS